VVEDFLSLRCRTRAVEALASALIKDRFIEGTVSNGSLITHEERVMNTNIVMRFIVALLALLVSDAAVAQQRTYRDSMGRNIGRSITDTRGNTTSYDAMGRNTGRSVTDSRGNTTFYDSFGRNTGRSTTNGNKTTTYDSFGRRTGSTQRSR
jgi:YD repeat-containing protein